MASPLITLHSSPVGGVFSAEAPGGLRSASGPRGTSSGDAPAAPPSALKFSSTASPAAPAAPAASGWHSSWCGRSMRASRGSRGSPASVPEKWASTCAVSSSLCTWRLQSGHAASRDSPDEKRGARRCPGFEPVPVCFLAVPWLPSSSLRFEPKEAIAHDCVFEKRQNERETPPFSLGFGRGRGALPRCSSVAAAACRPNVASSADGTVCTQVCTTI